MLPLPWIHEDWTASRVEPAALDELWSRGCRRFGTSFFRYNIFFSDEGLDLIVPLRIRLEDFSMSKSQRRIWRRNEDTEWEIRRAGPSPELCDLFARHKLRFKKNIPESLAVFLGDDPEASPCECLEFRCLVRGRLIAASFLDVGATGVSGVYAVFDPEESRRSPGILTMLHEIEWARARGMSFYYPGYATLGSSAYDYKKKFRGLEGFNWKEEAWRPLAMSQMGG